MDYRNIPQENKAEILEQAVLNEAPERLAQTYRELGNIEMTARALGLACRFGGVEKVKTLAECGATFDIPHSEEVERLYHCYSGMKHDNYRSNYSLYLLKIFKQIKGAFCMKGLKLLKQAATNDKKYLPVLPDSERLEVLRFLCENKDRLSFFPSEMLYHAIFARDTIIVDELKRLGTELSEVRVKKITEGGIASDSYRYEWYAMMSKLSDEDYLPVMEKFALELNGGRFYCTEKIYDITKKRFADPKIFEFFCDHFRHDKINKAKIIRGLIDENLVDALPMIESIGWLDNTKRRDEMIEYASANGKTECEAFFLDFKNRTADFAAEHAKAEKKLERELNAALDSVTALKQIWSYKKQDDADRTSAQDRQKAAGCCQQSDLGGSLMITGYKGSRTEVIVPEKIGKNTVTAIGNKAFSPWNARIKPEAKEIREAITKITLPDTVRLIECNAFGACTALVSVNIPDGVTKIGHDAFCECHSLEKIIIPKSVRTIEDYAFSFCHSLKSIEIPEGVEEIGEYAFAYCSTLTKLVLPGSLKSIGRVIISTGYGPVDVAAPRGSLAEEYCKSHGIPYVYKED